MKEKIFGVITQSCDIVISGNGAVYTADVTATSNQLGAVFDAKNGVLTGLSLSHQTCPLLEQVDVLNTVLGFINQSLTTTLTFTIPFEAEYRIENYKYVCPY